MTASSTNDATFTTQPADVTARTWVDDPYPCPVCGKPRPWHVWFSKNGKGCFHAK